MTTMTPNQTRTIIRDGEKTNEIQLSAKRFFRIDPRLDKIEIRSLGGTLWLTLPNDPNDYLLRSGDQVSVNTKSSKGAVLLEALSEARFTIN
jgi:hypothetical protein